MALGELTKQIAQQALLNATNPKEAPPAPVIAAAPPDPSGPAILAQIGAMQKALKEDEDLVVQIHIGGEKLRVVEIFLPSPQVAVISGFDQSRALVRVISAIPALQLVCRTAKIPAGAKPTRIGLVTPKPKDSTA